MKYSLITIALLAVFSCQTKNQESIVEATKDKDSIQQTIQEPPKPKYEPIYITTFTYAEKNGKETKNEFKTDALTSDYLEIDLKSLRDGTYEASKNLKPITDPNNYTAIAVTISDKNRKTLYFQDSGEFLNFMSSHGYEMVDQTKNKYGANYTFKKK